MLSSARPDFAVPGLASRIGATLACALMLVAGAPAMAQSTWPEVPVPKGVAPFDMGEQMTANGLPLRMRGVVSAAAPAQVAALFREGLGQPLVENTLGSKLVLGRAQGEFYVTVQLEPAGGGTRGIIAVTKLSAAINERASSHLAEQRLLARFPPDSKLVSQTASVDGGRRALHQVLVNSDSVGANAERLKRTLGAEGFTLERETRSADQTRASNGRAPRGATLYFKRQGGESIAVIHRDDKERTAIVLNTVTYAERAK